LSIAGVLWTLEPLPLPEPVTAEPASALTSPAVQLLVERAQALRPGFTVDNSTVEHAVAVCRRLDGLPLAIELAAGQLGERDLVRLAAELTVRTLRTELVDVPPRHRTLMDTVEWSVALLSDAERFVFEVLGVFRGRVAVEALAALMLATPGELVTGPLSRLAAASLLRLTHSEESVIVDLLDTIREIARHRLDEAGLADRYERAHAQYMLAVVRSGDRDATDGQLDDVRAAVEFACAHAGELLDRGVVSGLADHLALRGRFAEAHRLLAAIAGAASTPASTQPPG
jgi:predicted ATPase